MLVSSFTAARAFTGLSWAGEGDGLAMADGGGDVVLCGGLGVPGPTIKAVT